jgi:hypothetical protein
MIFWSDTVCSWWFPTFRRQVLLPSSRLIKIFKQFGKMKTKSKGSELYVGLHVAFLLRNCKDAVMFKSPTIKYK